MLIHHKTATGDHFDGSADFANHFANRRVLLLTKECQEFSSIFGLLETNDVLCHEKSRWLLSFTIGKQRKEGLIS